ncbi:MAG: hypothetical protein ABSG57_07610 [Candidatus Bathyarchaeia archaeon]
MSEVMWIVTNHEENGLDISSELTPCSSFVTSDVMCVVMFCCWAVVSSVCALYPVYPSNVPATAPPPYVSNVRTASHIRPAVSEMVSPQEQKYV